MIYALLRAAAGIALRWFYRDIEVTGIDRVPRRRPLLVVVNHPNALVDALIVAWTLPRRVVITAKATLFRDPIAAALLSWLGVLPLRRSSDARGDVGGPDPSRNRDTFLAVRRALERRRAVLIFPEGRSHDEPTLAPLKTGAARMALDARASGGVPDLMILPIGLTFERKDLPRTRVFVQIGEPMAMKNWQPPTDGSAVEALTHEMETRLRAVTLNYATSDDAARAAALSSVIASLFTDVPSLGSVEPPLSAEASIARRIAELRSELAAADPILRNAADRLAHRLQEFQRATTSRGLLIQDVGISTRLRSAVRFVFRETWLLLLVGPLVLWGKLNHWLPFNAARALAKRSVETAADPAMRTIVAGAVLVLVAYLAQALVVALVLGPLAAAIYVFSLPVAADLNLSMSDRVARALCRARAFVSFRRDPAFHQRLAAELEQLRQDTLVIDAALRSQAATAI